MMQTIGIGMAGYGMIGRVHCLGYRDIPLMYPRQVDDAAWIEARLRSGAHGTIEVSRFATGTLDDLRFEIYGRHGALRFDLMEPNWLYLHDARRSGGAPRRRAGLDSPGDRPALSRGGASSGAHCAVLGSHPRREPVRFPEGGRDGAMARAGRSGWPAGAVGAGRRM